MSRILATAVCISIWLQPAAAANYKLSLKRAPHAARQPGFRRNTFNIPRSLLFPPGPLSSSILNPPRSPSAHAHGNAAPDAASLSAPGQAWLPAQTTLSLAAALPMLPAPRPQTSAFKAPLSTKKTPSGHKDGHAGQKVHPVLGDLRELEGQMDPGNARQSLDSFYLGNQANAALVVSQAGAASPVTLAFPEREIAMAQAPPVAPPNAMSPAAAFSLGVAATVLFAAIALLAIRLWRRVMRFRDARDPLPRELRESLDALESLEDSDRYQAFETLSSAGPLEIPVLVALAELLVFPQKDTRKFASELIGRSSSLAPRVRRAIEANLENKNYDARYRSARLLLADTPRHRRAQRVTREPAPVPRHEWLENLDYSLTIDDRWAPPPVYPAEEIRRLAIKKYRDDKFVSSDEANDEDFQAFLRYLDRVLEYGRSQKRMTRMILRSLELSPGTYINHDHFLRDPQEQLLKDSDTHYAVHDDLSQFVRAVVARRNEHARKEGGARSNIAGVMVVGGFVYHPGARSDINLLIVTHDGTDNEVFNFVNDGIGYGLGSLFDHGFGLTEERAHHVHNQGVIGVDSLNFKREQALGSIFYGAEEQSPPPRLYIESN